MKKILTLLAVTVITANLVGCGACRRCCPWLYRGDAWAPAPVAPYAVAPPQYQYAAPLAATVPNSCCPTTAPMMSYGYAEPGCACMEPSCGQPYVGGVSYAPAMMSGCTTCGSCGTCGTGYGGTIMTPTPTTGIFPVPGE